MIPDEIFIPYDGILGVEFPFGTKARLNFQTQELEVDGGRVPMKRKSKYWINTICNEA